MNLLSRKSAITLLVLASASASQAALLFYDGFDYPTGIIDGTQNGGTGGLTAWVEGEGNAPSIVNPGLTFTGLVTGGNAMTDATAQSRSTRRTFDNTGLGGDGTSIWFSALYQHTSAGSDFRLKLFTDETLSLGSSGFAVGPGAGIGFNFTGGTGLRVENQGAQLGTATSLSIGTTYLIVGRIDFSDTVNNDRVLLWVDPTISMTAPSDASAAQDVFTELQATLGKGVVARWGGTGTGILDEIRLGTSFADVVAIPEPSTSVLLLGGLLGGLGAFIARRRRPAA